MSQPLPLNKSHRSIEICCYVNGLHRPEEDRFIPRDAAEIQGLFHQPPADSSPPDLRLQEKPAKLSLLLCALDYGHRARDPITLLQDPYLLPAGFGLGKLRQRHSHINLKRMVPALLESMEDAVHVYDISDIPWMEVMPHAEGWIGKGLIHCIGG